MENNFVDKSNFLRGLLVLIALDKVVTNSEKKYVTEIGLSLGFEKDFCDDSIKNILANKYIVNTPPKFLDNKITECFIRQGIKISFGNTKPHSPELQWLFRTAKTNSFSKEWFVNELNNYIETQHTSTNKNYLTEISNESFKEL